MSYISILTRNLDKICISNISDIIMEYVGGLYIPRHILPFIEENIEFCNENDYEAECSIESEYIDRSTIIIETNDGTEHKFEGDRGKRLYKDVIEELGIKGLDTIVNLKAINPLRTGFARSILEMDYPEEIEETINIFKYKQFCDTVLDITHYHTFKKN